MSEVDAPGRTPLQEQTPAEGGDSEPGQSGMDSKFSRMKCGAAPHNKYVYDMNHKERGLFVIINNRRFDPSTGMGERSGPDTDADNLYTIFEELGFQVLRYNNLRRDEMLKVMAEASRQNHTNADCFACAMLSHGDEGVIYGTDGQIRLDRLIDPFKDTLLGKPKIFIIQAFRGTQLDHGTTLVQGDADSPMSEDKIYRIPTESDFVYAYSTVAGQHPTKGSWFVQALCRMLKEHGRTMDFLRILTRVNHEVVYEFESKNSEESINEKKQIPSTVSMLTKDLVFIVKK